jgi:fucose 4-O-acetylase-like acetyltransferase
MAVAERESRAEVSGAAAFDRTSAAKARSTGLDFLKGTLLLFVMLGHFPAVPLEQSYLKQVIYSFHMPVFIIVTGYLFNAEKWSRAPFWDFVRHYALRLLLPWVIASAVYYAEKAAQGVPLRTIAIYSIFQPWSLLWFVPAAFLMMAASVLLMRARVGALPIFAVSTLAVLALEIWFRRYGRDAGEAIQSLIVLGDRRYYLYFPFFAFGLLLRNGLPEIPMPLAAAVIAGGAALYFAGTVVDDPAAFLFVNFMVGAAAIAVAAQAAIPRVGGVVTFLGRESLPIYLWHYIPILVARHFAAGATFAALASVGIALVVLTVYVIETRVTSSLLRGVVLGRWAAVSAERPEEGARARKRVPAA